MSFTVLRLGLSAARMQAPLFTDLLFAKPCLNFKELSEKPAHNIVSSSGRACN